MRRLLGPWPKCLGPNFFLLWTKTKQRSAGVEVNSRTSHWTLQDCRCKLKLIASMVRSSWSNVENQKCTAINASALQMFEVGKNVARSKESMRERCMWQEWRGGRGDSSKEKSPWCLCDGIDTYRCDALFCTSEERRSNMFIKLLQAIQFRLKIKLEAALP